MVVKCVKMTNAHKKMFDNIGKNYNSKIINIPYRKGGNKIIKKKSSIRYPYFYIQQRNINYLKNKNCTYSKYYSNEPVYNISNPILNYDVLDLIKIYGRLAEHSEYESVNIIIHKLNLKGEKDKGEIRVKTNETEKIKNNINILYTKILSFFNRPNNTTHVSNTNHNNDMLNKTHWFNHFLKYGKMNYEDFKKALLVLKFKWPKDAMFPSYNLFLFDKGLSKNMDSPLMRKKIEHFIQHDSINDNLLKVCFYCFSSGKDYLTANDILNTFILWNKHYKYQKKQTHNKKNSFSFFEKKKNNEQHSIDWFTFKKNIDACTIQTYEQKK
ncbi:conserved protein, unknown function [Hepatocystis sp. ex Piliocolobus tephrosceles]|nr:conserved protein, unknown function [Hepatocystis sp. ex Piliocolobus tephrosceles]